MEVGTAELFYEVKKVRLQGKDGL